jgi:hypothetical protein
MSEAVLSSLAAWQNFYVIIGSAAARLSGLLFVVITLVSGALGRVSSPWRGIRVFSTPSADAFWCCAADRRASERTLAGALACRPAGRSCGLSTPA